MTLKHLLIGTTLALALVSAARADEPNPVTAQAYLPACREAANETFRGNGVAIFDVGKCAGVVDALLFMRDKLDPSVRSCVPAGATPGQAIAIAVRYIDQRPERWNEPFVRLAAEALHAAWPCR
jgi:hypothetical protein